VRVARKGYNSQLAVCEDVCTTVIDPNSINACGGGGSGGPTYMCSSNQLWAVNNSLAFGFAAANIQGLSEPQWYLKTFIKFFYY
jgi:hypothetical protein